MAFCDGAEDINSVCLTAVHNLMGEIMSTWCSERPSIYYASSTTDKYGIKAGDVGRLEVGTETMVSVRGTWLMRAQLSVKLSRWIRARLSRLLSCACFKQKEISTLKVSLCWTQVEFTAHAGITSGIDNKNACYGGNAHALCHRIRNLLITD